MPVVRDIAGVTGTELAEILLAEPARLYKGPRSDNHTDMEQFFLPAVTPVRAGLEAGGLKAPATRVPVRPGCDLPTLQRTRTAPESPRYAGTDQVTANAN